MNGIKDIIEFSSHAYEICANTARLRDIVYYSILIKAKDGLAFYMVDSFAYITWPVSLNVLTTLLILCFVFVKTVTF